MTKVNVYCDGSYSPGVIGWAWFSDQYDFDGGVVSEQNRFRYLNSDPQTAEMFAAYDALQSFPSQNLRIYTDSTYVVKYLNSEKQPKINDPRLPLIAQALSIIVYRNLQGLVTEILWIKGETNKLQRNAHQLSNKLRLAYESGLVLV